jgi:hypothetical protein
MMEFHVNVSGVKFVVDAEDESEAGDLVNDILQEVAFDWGQVSVA